jgi:DMSO/TMAO reductase YedYZ heme-binding membrane subunit
MITQSRISTQTDLKTLFDIILLSLGGFIGSLIMFMSLWLWFDYQADPGRSLLAIFSANLVTLVPAPLQVYLDHEAQLMGLPLTGQTPAYWYMARAGGLVAYVLLWLSTVWGLTLTTKITEGLVPAPIAYGLHEFLSLAAICFATLHGLVLLGDEYINFNILHLALPFLAPYKPFWTGLGTLALYLSVVLTSSFYIRKQIGQKTWRAMHYLTFAAYLLALGHGLMAGTDTSLPMIKLMYLGTGFSVLFLTYYRLFTLKTKPVKAA